MTKPLDPRDPLPVLMGLATDRLVRWPLGMEGEMTLLALADDAERLVPVLGGEPSLMIPAGIESVDVDPGQVAEELSVGPSFVLMLVPRSPAAIAFYDRLIDELELFGIQLNPALMPPELTVERMIAALPVGRDAVKSWAHAREQRLRDGLLMLWAASAADVELPALALTHLAGGFLPPMPD
jgi:hypothetical protein